MLVREARSRRIGRVWDGGAPQGQSMSMLSYYIILHYLNYPILFHIVLYEKQMIGGGKKGSPCPISSHGIPWPMESSESYGTQWTSRYTYVSSCGPRVSYKSYRIKWNPIVSSRVSYIVIDHHFELYGILWNPTDS